MGRDQNDNAVRVTERGAGLQLSPNAAAEEIRNAVIRLLAEPGFRQAARQLGDAIASETDPNRAAVELERLAASRAPRSGAVDATAAAPRLALAV
jgi:UDP:flavonoid glycosyltransferase YjiC (YdhE family)